MDAYIWLIKKYTCYHVKRVVIITDGFLISQKLTSEIVLTLMNNKSYTLINISIYD